VAQVPYYNIPDVRDGLTELERVILYVLHQLRKEVGDRHVSAFQVYGRVVEYLDVRPDEVEAVLAGVRARSMPVDRDRQNKKEEHE
jgi:hypothetical protein